MCRFLIYKGGAILMDELLMQPSNSLIRQSHHARESSDPLNGDGFGIGWYTPAIDRAPCVFTSVTPAWNSRNLQHLAQYIKSSCFFAHLRAASQSMLVSEVNCHPFQYGRFLWMHNGTVAEFPKIKRQLRQSLSDDTYNCIQGTTDSEHAFAVFLNKLADPYGDYACDVLQHAMEATIDQLNMWSREAEIGRPSYYNFAVTDGRSVIATRYASESAQEPPSLYFSSGTKFECSDGVGRMIQIDQSQHAVIIASEPLTDAKEDWAPIPKNHLLMVTQDLSVQLIQLES
jgi:ergothioneine biosynthesis protein EgtC